jgi:hypothetical protein
VEDADADRFEELQLLAKCHPVSGEDANGELGGVSSKTVKQRGSTHYSVQRTLAVRYTGQLHRQLPLPASPRARYARAPRVPSAFSFLYSS